MSNSSNAQGGEKWSSRWGFIAATIGMAIGTGNIWRFPRVAANNGGGAFIIAWTVALLIWSIPLLMAEMVIGKQSKAGTIGSFKKFVGKNYAWMGAFIAFVCFAIMSYYSVVMGWCLKYFMTAVSGGFNSTTSVNDTMKIWESFINSPAQTISLHLVSIGIAVFVIYRGVTGGIEKTCKMLIPSLFLILLFIAVRAAFLPNAVEGYKYLFTPDFSQLLSGKIWLEAFTQSAWSTGAGWGFIITYSSYTSSDSDIGLNSFLTGFGNNMASILAAMAIIPTIFALSGSLAGAQEAFTSGNTGLTFIYLASLFPTMGGGQLLASLFFFAMAISALSSLIAMLEVCTKILMDTGKTRQKASIIVGIAGFLVGIPSAYNIEFLNNQDMVWGVALLISGLFCAYALFKYGVEKARTDIINGPWADIYIGKWWSYCIYIFPALFSIVFIWWIYQSISWYPDTWYSPFETYSAGTIIIQITIAILIIKGVNSRFVKAHEKGGENTNAS
ncbi:neurotransmitter:Na+ symporter, NSS family [Peptoclostridium litorale DSM 5388]|uniref:Transporter n=1 Tax=Peptoclostridium litorale DSM 5388 TaxID=1121324 RepID=A0A069RDG6_PEPLI|nr:sodium-dependent transporter [Peptoclostridium litorale]KDR94265.1 transporter [Peptoclostridium litorale DSM 5388]SIO28281.1 neurotransmitter:Na+ symporter, NSS family [Peptoclostridium litorale DSM 5388]